MIDGGLRKAFHKNIKRCHWTAIESGLTSQGIPDTHFCMDGVAGWIEFKACRHWRVPMRPEQIGWIEKQLRHGGCVFLAIRRNKTELWLLRGDAARVAKAEGLRALPKRSILGVFLEPWPWDQIRRCLITAR